MCLLRNVKNLQEHRRILAVLKETFVGNISGTVSGCRGLDPRLEKGWAVMSLLQRSAEAQSTEETELFCSRSKEGRKQEMTGEKYQFLQTLKSHIHLCSLHSYCFQKFRLSVGGS